MIIGLSYELLGISSTVLLSFAILDDYFSRAEGYTLVVLVIEFFGREKIDSLAGLGPKLHGGNEFENYNEGEIVVLVWQS